MHPNAGKAFIDHFLGDDSLKIMAKHGEFVTRKGIYPPIPDADKIQIVEMDELDTQRLRGKAQRVPKDLLSIDME